MPPTTRDQLRLQRDSLEQQEADLQAQWLTLQTELDREYRDFRRAVDSRIDTLGKSYRDYATHFLGIPCELSEQEAGDIVTLSCFVPSFNSIPRPTEETCSEAQRFFLDIAFRMALIDLARLATEAPATFICETPETALDVSYVDNVVEMLRQFTGRGHGLLLSANIQPNGIAGKVLHLLPTASRPRHVLNLLDIGQLSEVHQRSIQTLQSVVREYMA